MGMAVRNRNSLLKWAYRLAIPDGDILMMSINGKFLKVLSLIVLTSHI